MAIKNVLKHAFRSFIPYNDNNKRLVSAYMQNPSKRREIKGVPEGGHQI